MIINTKIAIFFLVLTLISGCYNTNENNKQENKSRTNYIKNEKSETVKLPIDSTIIKGDTTVVYLNIAFLKNFKTFINPEILLDSFNFRNDVITRKEGENDKYYVYKSSDLVFTIFSPSDINNLYLDYFSLKNNNDNPRLIEISNKIKNVLKYSNKSIVKFIINDHDENIILVEILKINNRIRSIYYYLPLDNW